MTLYHSANAARAAAPRLTSEELPRTGAALAVFCAGALVVPDAPAPRVAVPDAPAAEEPVPVPLPPVVPEPVPEPPVPVPLPAAWPGLRFSVAFAASAVKADIVFSPDVGLLSRLVMMSRGGKGCACISSETYALMAPTMPP